MGHMSPTNPFGCSLEPMTCSFPNCSYVSSIKESMRPFFAICEAADAVMHLYAESHWNEDSFGEMLAAMEPLRQALVAAGYGVKAQPPRSAALRQAEADVLASAPLEGCSRCVDKANELYALHVQLDAAEKQRHVLARKLMEDNTFLASGHEFPEGFTPRFEPETDEHAVLFWIEWAEQKVTEEQE